MSDFLAQVALGPVQGFIAAARVMRDFAFGSQLLSYLANKTAQHLHGSGAELIFPATVGVVNSNKIMVIFRNHVESDARQKLIDAEHHVRQELFDMATAFFGQYANGELDSHDAAVWQVTDVLEYYWGMCEVQDNEYAAAVRSIDRLLAARKMTRDCMPNRHASAHFKSSLTGTYESVIPKTAYVAEHDSATTRQQKAQSLVSRYGIHGAEYLSGIDLFKRMYQLPNAALNFVSPRAMAARSIVVGMNEMDFAAFDRAWQQFAHTSFWQASPEVQAELVLDEDADRFDLQEWYAESAANLEVPDHFNHDWCEYDAKIRGVAVGNGTPFRDSRVSMAIFPAALQQRLEELDRAGELVDLQNEIATLVELYGITLPSLPRRSAIRSMLRAGKRSSTPYYAMLKADGDNMGKYVTALATQGIVAHQQFSHQVAQFAASVPAIVERYHGYCVYVGGDDLLAMVPLRNAIVCARALQDAFHEALAPIHQPNTLAIPQSATLSIGCVMVHHNEAIDDVIRILSKTAQYAKQRKSALAICLAKRSGSALTVAGQWGQFDTQMQQILQMSVSRQIPHGYAYELRELLLRMDNTSIPILANVIESEAQRILARKKQSENQRVDVNQITHLINNVIEYGNRGDTYGRFDQWVSQVIVAQNLSA